jgi:aminoglycoside phosphotransferase (APT) family kinase protein
MPPKGGPVLVGWTEGGIGDPRVDVGWASLILSEAYGGALRTPFLRAYRAGRSIAPEDLGWFEALAAVRRIAELASAGGGSREAQEHALAWLRQRLHSVDITPVGEGLAT